MTLKFFYPVARVQTKLNRECQSKILCLVLLRIVIEICFSYSPGYLLYIIFYLAYVCCINFNLNAPSHLKPREETSFHHKIILKAV